MEWENYKKIEKRFFKRKKLTEGDVVLYETIEGRWKKAVIKNTVKGTPFIEAYETSNSRDVMVVRIKDYERESLIYVPSYEELAKLAQEKIPTRASLVERIL